MATGDLAGNLERLRVELKHIKYTGDLDIAGIRLGDPVALLPLLNYVLVKFSRHVAQAIVSNGYELHGKTDARFVECAFKVMRELFNLRPVLTPAQFLEQGFAERKVLLLSSLIQYCKTEHTAAVRKVRLAAAVPPKLTSPQSSRKGNAAPPASAKSGRLKPSKLQFMAHNETPVLVVTRHSQQPSTSRHSSPIKLQQDASPSVSQRTQHSTATSSKPVPADRTGTDTIQQRTSGVDKQPYTAGSTRVSRKTWAESVQSSADWSRLDSGGQAEQSFQPSQAWFLNRVSSGRSPRAADSELPPEPHCGAYPVPFAQTHAAQDIHVSAYTSPVSAIELSQPRPLQPSHDALPAQQRRLAGALASSLPASAAASSPVPARTSQHLLWGVSDWSPQLPSSSSIPDPGIAAQSRLPSGPSCSSPSTQSPGYGSQIQEGFAVQHQQPVREVDIPMEPFHPAHPAASQPSRTPATVDESPVALGSAVPPPQPPAAQPQHAQPSDLRVEEPGQACTAQTAAEAQPEYSADLEVGELARLVASLQERVAAAEMEADASRRESAAVQETLQARVTLLEGRVRFLEGRLEAHLAPAEAMQPASRAAPPEQPPGFRPGQLEVPGAPDTPVRLSIDKSAPGSGSAVSRERRSAQVQAGVPRPDGSPSRSTAATAQHFNAGSPRLTGPNAVPWRADAALAARSQAAGTSPARIAQASYRSTHDLISSIQDRYQEAQRLLQSYAK